MTNEVKLVRPDMLVDSRVLAERLENQHRNVLTLIESQQEYFEQFGPLSFETQVRAGQQKSGGGLPERYALLNEDQSYFLLSLSRNSAVVVALKAALIASFKKARESAGITTFKLPSSFSEALRLAAELEDKRAALELQNGELEKEKAILAPKAEAFDQLMSADGTYSMDDAAKILGMGGKTLFELLRDRGTLMDKKKSGNEHHNVPYQQFVDRGYFTVITRPRPSSNGAKVSQTTRVTPKGLTWMQKGLTKLGLAS